MKSDIIIVRTDAYLLIFVTNIPTVLQHYFLFLKLYEQKLL